LIVPEEVHVLILLGPGDSKEDVKWLDDNLREFFSKHV
jgi:hypothetical protein